MQVGEVQNGEGPRTRVEHRNCLVADCEAIALDQRAPREGRRADGRRYPEGSGGRSRGRRGQGQASLPTVTVTGDPGTVGVPAAGLLDCTLSTRAGSTVRLGATGVRTTQACCTTEFG